MGLDAVILVFWMLSFKSAFSLSSFTLIKRLFSSSLLSAIRVISSAYLRLLIFLLAILIPVCESSSPTFHKMYSANKLSKQSDNIQLWHTLSHFWTILCFGYCKQCCCEHSLACIFLNYILSRYMPRNGVFGSYGNSIFCFGNLHTVFHNICINFHPHQWHKRVPFFPYILQHLFKDV